MRGHKMVPNLHIVFHANRNFKVLRALFRSKLTASRLNLTCGLCSSCDRVGQLLQNASRFLDFEQPSALQNVACGEGCSPVWSLGDSEACC